MKSKQSKKFIEISVDQGWYSYFKVAIPIIEEFEYRGEIFAIHKAYFQGKLYKKLVASHVNTGVKLFLSYSTLEECLQASKEYLDRHPDFKNTLAYALKRQSELKLIEDPYKK